jgi:hypothetical protein
MAASSLCITPSRGTNASRFPSQPALTITPIVTLVAQNKAGSRAVADNAPTYEVIGEIPGSDFGLVAGTAVSERRQGVISHWQYKTNISL